MTVDDLKNFRENEVLGVVIPDDRSDLDKRTILFEGDKCDGCGKTLEELGVHKLDTCFCCKMVYCSSQKCGTKTWNAGHQEHCRKNHEILNVDTMQIIILVSKPELNAQLVDILGTDPQNNDAESQSWWPII
jgi:hypothetical protein